VVAAGTGHGGLGAGPWGGRRPRRRPGCRGGAGLVHLAVMARFRFLHVADLHLDTPFEGLGSLPGGPGGDGWAERLRDASLGALDEIARIARAEDVAFVLFAGDLYDGPERGLRAALRLRRVLGELAREGIPSFLVLGNHDPVEDPAAILPEPIEGVTLFPAGRAGTAPAVRDGATLALVHGASHGRPRETRNLAARFPRAGAVPLPEGAPPPPDPAGGRPLEIGLLHANLAGTEGHDPYAPCSRDDLLAAGYGYWALGHVHQRQVVVEGGTWIVYPGNTQGRSFKPSERGAKGGMLVEVEDGRVAHAEFRPLDRVRFEEVDLEVSAGTGPDRLLDRLAAAGGELVDAAEGRGVIARARVRVAEVGAPLLAPGRAEDLLAELRETAPEDLAWADLRLVPAADPRELAGRRDLAGELATLLAELQADPEEAARFAREVAGKMPRLGPVRRVLGEAFPEPGAAELAEAGAAVLARLVGGDAADEDGAADGAEDSP